MKILRYFFYVLLIVFGLFLGIGVVLPQVEYETEVEVNANPEKCWQVFNDTSKMSEWLLNFESIEAISETSDMIGSKYLITVVVEGQVYEMTETITTYDPHDQFAIQMENDELINDVNYTFEVSGNGTRISSSYQLRGKGLIMKAIFPFMKGMFLKEVEGNMNKLKDTIEAS